jgi:ribosome-associated protein YbcJ (S4-like RNA binding protein)
VSNVDEFKLKVQGISSTGDAAKAQMASAVLNVDQSSITRFGR